MRKTVGSKELKTRLGTYLRLVKEGDVIIVTERGRPVAELVAIRPQVPAADDDAILDRLAEQGLITRGKRGPLPDLDPIPYDGPSLSDAIIEDREQGW